MKYDEALKDTITYNLKMPKTFVFFLRRVALDMSEEKNRKITHADLTRAVLLDYFDKEYRRFLSDKN